MLSISIRRNWHRNPTAGLALAILPSAAQQQPCGKQSYYDPDSSLPTNHRLEREAHFSQVESTVVVVIIIFINVRRGVGEAYISRTSLRV